MTIIAYYMGDESKIDSYAVNQLTHIIYSFCHLKGNRLSPDNERGERAIKKLVSLKKKNPGLKIMVALGGWGGCETCSDVFATDAGRKEFASSVKQLNKEYGTDGIDLDWEYPTISGYPGHKFQPADKANFTALVQTLRDTLDKNSEISFAAGAHDRFLQESVEWDKLHPLVDRINLMTYDLVGGYSKTTGHHTALYSTDKQGVSADHAVNYLQSVGVPLNKMVIGAAFYARTWEAVADTNNGLYQAGKFKSFVGYSTLNKNILQNKDFTVYFDSVAKAPYAYSKEQKLFATFDDLRSIELKTRYAKEKGLNGIMFWELTLDLPRNGLLDKIYTTSER